MSEKKEGGEGKDSILKTCGGIVILCLVASFFGLLIWRALWVTNVDKHQLAFSFDRKTGEIEVIDHTGWVVLTPIRYSVHRIDLRPYQLTISVNQRVLNAKLVRFDPKGLATFVEWHGRNAGDYTGNLLEILKCYAFDMAEGKDCPFLKVIQVIAPNQGAQELPAIDIEEKK